MAGDWIKMRHDLPEDPAVIAISVATGIGEDAVVGKLHRFWSWADRQTVNGNAVGVTQTWLDRFVSCDGFASAMVAAGWLEVSEGGLTLPGFDVHISESAKTRALAARRAAKHRNANRNGGSVTKSAPREEKRRDNKTPISPFDGLQFPEGFDTPAVRESIVRWLEHKRARGEAYKKPANQLALKLREFRSAADFVAAVDSSIGNNYQGIFPPKGVAVSGTKQSVPSRVRQRDFAEYGDRHWKDDADPQDAGASHSGESAS